LQITESSVGDADLIFTSPLAKSSFFGASDDSET